MRAQRRSFGLEIEQERTNDDVAANATEALSAGHPHWEGEVCLKAFGAEPRCTGGRRCCFEAG